MFDWQLKGSILELDLDLELDQFIDDDWNVQFSMTIENVTIEKCSI